jgi:signal transduction histidine kinase
MPTRIYKIGFRIKIALAVCLVLVGLIGLGLGVGYHYASASLREIATEGLGEMARLMAATITDLVDDELKALKADADSDVLQDAVKVANLRYENMDAAGIQRYLADTNRRWAASADAPLVKEYMENPAGLWLKSDTGFGRRPPTILVTDRFGGLVASTTRTSGFYQGDKDWWREAFDEGRGKMVIGELFPGESSGAWRMPFAVPVRDNSGNAIGVCMEIVNIDIFFKELAGFRIGVTGTAALVDDKGYVVFQRGTRPYSNKFCGYEDLQKLLRAKSGRLVMDGVYLHDRRAFVASAEAGHPLFAKKGMLWVVAVVQDEVEVMSALDVLFSQLITISAILVLIAFAAVFLFTGILLAPVRNLHEGIEHMKRGDYDYRVNLKGAYEMESLGDSFNEMAAGLKKSDEPFIRAISRLGSIISPTGEALRSISGEMAARLGEKQKKSMAEAEKDIERAARITNALLDIARIRAGELTLNPAPKDLRDVIKDALFVFEPNIRGKGLDLKLDIPKGPINVTIDSSRIAQVFSHLLDNAMRFTEKGSITISVKVMGGDIQCSVSDTGIGISREDLPNVFNLQRLGLVHKGQEKGIGAGLCLSKAIIELHKGKMWIESQVGKGTTVTFLLRR